jgi:hypothetical protein
MFLLRKDRRPCIDGGIIVRGVVGNSGRMYVGCIQFRACISDELCSTWYKTFNIYKTPGFSQVTLSVKEGFCWIMLLQIFAMYVYTVHFKDLFCVLVVYHKMFGTVLLALKCLIFIELPGESPAFRVCNSFLVFPSVVYIQGSGYICFSVTLDEPGTRSPLCFTPKSLSSTLNFCPLYCRDVGPDLKAIGFLTVGQKKCV